MRSTNVWILRIVVAIFFFLGCTQGVWTTSSAVVPQSYPITEIPIERNVGKLRRLALMPVAFSIDSGHASRELNGKARIFREQTFTNAKRFLVHGRGYDVALVKLKQYPRDSLQQLVEWSSSSKGGEEPSDEIRELVMTIARDHDVDGVVVMQGYLEIVSVAGAIVLVATAGLVWPIVLMVDSGSMLRMDLYEAESGRIVWRAIRKGWIGDPHSDPSSDPSLDVPGLLYDLEHAVPEAMIESHPSAPSPL